MATSNGPPSFDLNNVLNDQDNYNMLDECARSVYSKLSTELKLKRADDKNTASVSRLITHLPALRKLVQHLDSARTILFSNPDELYLLDNHLADLKKNFNTDVHKLFDSVDLPVPNFDRFKNITKGLRTEGGLTKTINRYEQYMAGFNRFCHSDYSFLIFPGQKKDPNDKKESPEMEEYNVLNQNHTKMFSALLQETAETRSSQYTPFSTFTDVEKLKSNPVHHYEIQTIIARLYTPQVFLNGDDSEGATKREREDPIEDEKDPKKQKTDDAPVLNSKKRQRDDESEIEKDAKKARGNEKEPYDDSLFTDTHIGELFSLIAKKENKTPLELQNIFYRAEGIFHFLSALYAFMTNMINIIVMANEVLKNKEMKEYTTKLSRFETNAHSLRDIVVYYHTHVYTSLFPYYNYNSKTVVSAATKALPTVLLSDNQAAIDNKSILNDLDGKILKLSLTSSDLESKFMNRGVYSHLWSGISNTGDDVPHLYMPFMVWSAFQTVSIKATASAKAKNFDRGGTVSFRARILNVLAQYQKILLIDTGNKDEKDATESLSDNEKTDPLRVLEAFLNHEPTKLSYDKIKKSICDEWVRATFLMNHQIRLILDERDAYSYHYLYTLDQENEKINIFNWAFEQFDLDIPLFVVITTAKETKDKINRSRYVRDDQGNIMTKTALNTVQLEEENKIESEGKDKPEKNVKMMGKAHFLTSSKKSSINLFMDGLNLQFPIVLYDWFGLAGYSFQYLTLGNMTKTGWLPILPRSPVSALTGTFSVIKQKISTITVTSSNLQVIPRPFQAVMGDSVFLNASTLRIQNPLPNTVHDVSFPIHLVSLTEAKKTKDQEKVKENQFAIIEFSGLKQASNGSLIRTQKLKLIDVTKTPGKVINMSVNLTSDQQRYATAITNDRGTSTLTPEENAIWLNRANAFIAASIEIASPDTIKIDSEAVESKLEDYTACQFPSSVPNAILTDQFQNISHNWWDAHIFNDKYKVNLPNGEETIYSLEELKLVNKDLYLVKNLPYLGPVVEKVLLDKNYLGDMPDLKANILSGTVIEDIKLTGNDKETNIKVNVTKNKNTEDDIQHLNEYKLVRIGQDVINWLTDNSCMLTYSLENEISLDKAKHVPSVITDGLVLISHAYTSSTTDPKYKVMEFIKASNINQKLSPQDQNNNCIFFTPRLPVKQQQQRNKYEYNWMQKVSEIKNTREWILSEPEKDSPQFKFADIFQGFDGLGLSFSNRNINIRNSNKAIVDQRQKYEPFYKILKETMKRFEGVELNEKDIELTEEMANTLKESNKEKTKDVADVTGVASEGKNAEEKVITFKRGCDELNDAYRTYNPRVNLKPEDPIIMLIDLFDVKRLAVSNTKISHELLGDVHHLYITDDCIKNGNFAGKAGKLELLSLWKDPMSEFVVRINLDTIFLLMALRCIYAPISPFTFYNDYQTEYDLIMRESKGNSDNQFIPMVKNPEYGNIHSTSQFPTIVRNTILLGRVQNAYKAYLPVLQSEQKLFSDYPKETSDYVFYGLNRRLNKLKTLVDTKISTIEEEDAMDIDTPSDKDENGAELKNPQEKRIKQILDDATKTVPIWSCVSSMVANSHMDSLVGKNTLGTLWLPRCNTDFLEHPGSALCAVTDRNETNVMALYYNSLESSHMQYLDVVFPDQDADYMVYGRDLLLLNDTWDFPTVAEVELGDEDEEDAAYIATLTPEERSARAVVMGNFDLIAEHAFYVPAKHHSSTLYNNFCLMAMAVLQSKLKESGHLDSFLGKYAHWFTHKLSAPSVAYQIPLDVYQNSCYRHYYGLSTFLKIRTLIVKAQVDAETEDDDEEEDTLGDVAMTRKNVETETHIYLNEPLFSAMDGLRSRWNTMNTMNTMNSATDKSSEEDTEPDDMEKTKRSEENVRLYEAKYNTPDLSITTIPWKWNIYDLKLRHKDELQQLKEDLVKLENAPIENKLGAKEDRIEEIEELKKKIFVKNLQVTTNQEFIKEVRPTYDHDLINGVVFTEVNDTEVDYTVDTKLPLHNITLHRSVDVEKLFMYLRGKKEFEFMDAPEKLHYAVTRNYVPLPDESILEDGTTDENLKKMLTWETKEEGILSKPGALDFFDKQAALIIKTLKTKSSLNITFEDYVAPNIIPDDPMVTEEPTPNPVPEPKLPKEEKEEVFIHTVEPKQSISDMTKEQVLETFKSLSTSLKTQFPDLGELVDLFTSEDFAKVMTNTLLLTKNFKSMEVFEQMLMSKDIEVVNFVNRCTEIMLKTVADKMEQNGSDSDTEVYDNFKIFIGKGDNDEIEIFKRFRTIYENSSPSLSQLERLQKNPNLNDIFNARTSLMNYLHQLDAFLKNNPILTPSTLFSEELLPLMQGFYIQILIYYVYLFSNEETLRMRLSSDTYDNEFGQVGDTILDFNEIIHKLFLYGSIPKPIAPLAPATAPKTAKQMMEEKKAQRAAAAKK